MKRPLPKRICTETCQDLHTIPFKCPMKSVSVKAFFPPPYPVFVALTDSTNDFHERLAGLRKERGLTQQALANRVGGHVEQLKRCKAGSSQPTFEVIRKRAIALSVSSDQLLFGRDERGPDDVA